VAQLLADSSLGVKASAELALEGLQSYAGDHARSDRKRSSAADEPNDREASSIKKPKTHTDQGSAVAAPRTPESSRPSGTMQSPLMKPVHPRSSMDVTRLQLQVVRVWVGDERRGTGWYTNIEKYPCIVTAWHILKDANNAYVMCAEGKLKVDLLLRGGCWFDEKLDVAICRVDVEPFDQVGCDPLPIISRETVCELHSRVIQVGYPQNDKLELSADGEVREVLDDGCVKYSAKTSEGCSGSPVIIGGKVALVHLSTHVASGLKHGRCMTQVLKRFSAFLREHRPEANMMQVAHAAVLRSHVREIWWESYSWDEEKCQRLRELDTSLNQIVHSLDRDWNVAVENAFAKEDVKFKYDPEAQKVIDEATPLVISAHGRSALPPEFEIPGSRASETPCESWSFAQQETLLNDE